MTPPPSRERRAAGPEPPDKPEALTTTRADGPAPTFTAVPGWKIAPAASASRIRAASSESRDTATPPGKGSVADRRMRHLYLTEAGWAIYTEIASAAVEREAQIYAELSPGELQLLRELLAKLSRQARKAL